MTAEAPREPWTPAQVRLAIGCDLAAAVVLAVAASAARGDTPGRQVTWLNVAVLGLVLAVVVNGTMLLTARRAVGRRRLRLVPDVVATTPPIPSQGGGGWWWLPGTARAHLEGCQLIAGKPAEPVDPDRIRAEHLRRCEVCG